MSKPYEMTSAEWVGAIASLRPNTAQSNYTHHSASEAIARSEKLSELLFDVPAHDFWGGQLWDLSYAERYVLGIDRALREGKDVPPQIVDEAFFIATVMEMTKERALGLWKLRARLKKGVSVPDLSGGLLEEEE